MTSSDWNLRKEKLGNYEKIIWKTRNYLKVMICRNSLTTIKPYGKYRCMYVEKELGGLQFSARAVMHRFIGSVVE